MPKKDDFEHYTACKIKGCVNRAAYGPKLYRKSQRCDEHKLDTDKYTLDTEDKYPVLPPVAIGKTRSGRTVRLPPKLVLEISDDENDYEDISTGR